MLKPVLKNDHPDRLKSLIVSPMMSALTRVFVQLKLFDYLDVNSKFSRPQASQLQSKISFETLEPRVLLSGDINPAALTVAGTIATVGQQDHYQFSVEETRRVVFDSLTDRSDISWNLEGPNGQQITQRAFSNSDYFRSSAAFDLAPGQYQLTVDAQADALGAYALRIIDADAAAPMTPGLAVTGTLDSGNKTAVYKFTGTAGDKFIFPAGTLASTASASVDWRLIDPYGRQEGGTQDVRGFTDTFALQRTGQYLLLLEGAASNTAPVDYQFNLQPVQDSRTALPLDEVAVANIDQR